MVQTMCNLEYGLFIMSCLMHVVGLSGIANLHLTIPYVICNVAFGLLAYILGRALVPML